MSSAKTDVILRRDQPKMSADRKLSLAAAPTFAAMAALTGIHDSDMTAAFCAHGTSPLTGMTAMYLLMAFFHVTPWLRLLSDDGTGRPA